MANIINFGGHTIIKNDLVSTDVDFALSANQGKILKGIVDLKAPLSSPTFTGLITTAGQIAFPATQNPSSDPNTLDDYEEGTWNAVFSATVTPPDTPITMVGVYTKIGREVTVTVAFNDVNTTGASGDMFVHGLPFMAKTHECYGLAGQYNLASVPLMCSSVVNDTYLAIRSYETTIYAPIVAGTQKYLLVQCTYLAD